MNTNPTTVVISFFRLLSSTDNTPIISSLRCYFIIITLLRRYTAVEQLADSQANCILEPTYIIIYLCVGVLLYVPSNTKSRTPPNIYINLCIHYSCIIYIAGRGRHGAHSSSLGFIPFLYFTTSTTTTKTL
ncbi:unnamed protein product [Aphis gossypii]|uniref:Uncharacterized protein n=1 Tax=Aphis gossypii TaxID=80765 RepID=A0A9P0NCN9_APHGO|nr:unnamed protein product [Aphis gossypii]